MSLYRRCFPQGAGTLMGLWRLPTRVKAKLGATRGLLERRKELRQC